MAYRSRSVAVHDFKLYPCLSGTLEGLFDSDRLHYCGSFALDEIPAPPHVALAVPLAVLARFVPVVLLRKLFSLHKIKIRRGTFSPDDYRDELSSHQCSSHCKKTVAVFQRSRASAVNPFGRTRFLPLRHQIPVEYQSFLYPSSSSFPPPPMTLQARAQMIRDFTDQLSEEALAEVPCAVCAELVKRSDISVHNVCDELFLPLARLDAPVAVFPVSTEGTVPRVHNSPILEHSGLHVDDSLRVADVCSLCLTSLKKKKIPPRSLANGLWLGDIPPQLRALNYCEKLMVARFRHNTFVVSVTMGQRRMAANAVTFGQPVAKFHAILPPPPDDVESCLVVLFTGSCAPTPEDMKRTPLIVRKQVVWDALIWLKQNHKDYSDIALSRENLDMYKESQVPVSIVYRPLDGSAPASAPETLPVHDDGEERGTETGPCSFAVHSLTSEKYHNLSREGRISASLHHLASGRPVLAYGREENPESIYHNPLLFPGMFPWLFPYGLGGFENPAIITPLGREQHIQHLLMYHDRRFQIDEYFAFVLYSHAQIRGASLGGYLLTERKDFPNVAAKIQSLDVDTLAELARRGQEDGFVKPMNDKERQCFEFLHFVDHVGGHVPNSSTSKRRQRNQIQSLIYRLGTPVFFITFSPSDSKSPICMYLAGEKIDLLSNNPAMPDAAERLRAVARNPVACARFFDLVVNLFIKYILRWDTGTDGLFGPTAGFYGTVESQGRLTLHLHLLLWIKHSLSPQEIRDRALNDPLFQEELVRWLEFCCSGELAGGPIGDAFGDSASKPSSSAEDPMMHKPTPPPTEPLTDISLHEYMCRVSAETDAVLLKAYVHRCGPHCKRNGECRGRFPRDTVDKSSFDELGALHLAHKEEWLNTFTRDLAYLLRCNSDTACLLSGTQVRAIIAYVTDYVTKCQLKTYTLFGVIRAVLEKNSDLVSEQDDRSVAARRLLTKVVNALNAKMEIGGPMLCASLLGHCDHYTSHSFKLFFWYPYFKYVAEVWNIDVSDRDNDPRDTVVIGLDRDKHVVAHSKVHDYIHRPSHFDNWCLYDYMLRCSFMRYRCRKKNNQESVGIDPEALFGGSNDGDDNGRDPDEVVADSPAQTFRFNSNHPNVNTHRVAFTSNVSTLVLDFVGGRLPRQAGDTDIYFATMLLFFRPGGWRTGFELKAENQSWSDAFRSANFSEDSLSFMRRLNFLYECYDDRDDYSARRRKDQQGDALAMFSSSTLNALDVERTQDQVDDPTGIGSPDLDTLLVAEGRTAKVRLEIETVRAHMQLLAAHSAAFPYPSLFAIPKASQQQCTGRGWAKIVADEKLKRIAARARDAPELSTKDVDKHVPTYFNEVCVISADSCNRSIHASYLQSNEQVLFLGPNASPLLREVCAHFTLNAAQVRAVVTITSSVLAPSDHPLRMYLGGMGGTGKSQVIKALTAFFTARSERNRMSLMAPTGAAACLIGGSTYHSVLRLQRGNGKMTQKTRDELRQNLRGVDVPFFDEVSMISNTDLQQISSQLSMALGSSDAFGGKHVVLAGDFCQLPPVATSGSALYSNSAVSSATNKAQYKALGSSVWHQFTTVVILRENMRQRGLSIPDQQFRDALSRLRFRSCTDADLALFRSRVVGASGNAPRIFEPQFRDVSIITPWNAHRDGINEFQSERFAASTKQSLTSFYSRDKWTATTLKKSRSLGNSPFVASDIQEMLWHVPPCLVERHACGILKLCVGMPVMLKNNEATELCITNGAEAIVVGWKHNTHPSGKLSLDVLYVQLINPATDVQLSGLPLNVVPISSRAETVKVQLPNSSYVSISRTQVPVLPNFAMTDYGCQGRTRPFNSVDLRFCKNHQSAYTSLSRGSTIDGLLILHPFPDDIFKGGLTGDLRAELHDLEMLDDISRMIYEGSLELATGGRTRRDVLAGFRAIRGQHYQPSHTQNLCGKFAGNKRPRDEHCESESSHPPPKRNILPIAVESENDREMPPVYHGLKWDSIDYSCAYDALFTVFVNGARCFADMWETVTADNPVFDYFNTESTRVSTRNVFGTNLPPLERARDAVRDSLGDVDPLKFPRRGPVFAEIYDVAHAFTLLNTAYGTRFRTCQDCLSAADDMQPVNNLIWRAADVLFNVVLPTTVSALFNAVFEGQNSSVCRHCGKDRATWSVECGSVPSLLGMELSLEHSDSTHIDERFSLRLANEESVWELQAVIYLGSNHFTARFVVADGTVWYHDGAETGRMCSFEAASLQSISNLQMAGPRRACLVLYRRKQRG